MKLFNPLIVFFACTLFFSSAYARHKKPDIIAYYTGDGQTIKKYPVDKLSHIIYSFLHLNADTLSFRNDTQRNTLHQIAALKDSFPKLKIMISLGGWGGCATCSAVFSTDSSRKHFAESVVRILKEYNVDGIDLDWEYPSIEGFPGQPFSPADKEHFTALIKELRKKMGRHYELSFAAGGFTKYLSDAIDWDAVIPLVNRVNLMTYDLVSGYSTVTGHHTALYSRPEQVESTDHCVQYLLNLGVKSKKLAIGAAFYARVWGDIPPVNNGLYQTGVFKYGVDYKNFPQKLSSDSGWVHYWDDTAKAPYSYNAGLQQFASYDDDRSLAEKAAYARRYKLGGIMFWELTCDPYTNGRLDALYKATR